ncbi:UDP-N-acetylmuramate--L-alanine ligase [Neoactinobaculum massilliense]|uniref:UDP-N-acetylmuramate--L-alanine ligase n=1 Tax=Neoactinobaculum massilliense TaxID=2364794 RepID=UPI000F53F54B|nr:UDP-N-acetylmuramate--L-alanine ligase [Neoactinobaculum massilliense]
MIDRTFHLIGIGGAGMSVVAELLQAEGATVTGSDAAESAVTAALRAGGIPVNVPQRADAVPEGAIVVVSSAIKDANPELAEARRRGQTVIHRSQALALVSAGREFVAVAGAHGKTTTSGMIAEALRAAGEDPSWAIGGSLRDLGAGGHLGGGSVIVAEADESDGSFLNYAPRFAVVTNVEPDHLDHYGTAAAFEEAFAEFARRIVKGGLLIACGDDAGAARLGTSAAREGIRVVSYGRGEAILGAEAHVALSGHGEVTLRQGDRHARLRLAVPGAHNELNAAGAWAAGLELGVDPVAMAAGLAGFGGAKRRFEKRGEAGGVTVIDDYAHHPTEVGATVSAARERVRGRLLVLFQPHLYSRTRNFAPQFAAALDGADDVIVTGVYGAREQPFDGIEGNMITRLMRRGRFVQDRCEAAHEMAAEAQPGDMIITMGAGNVTELGPVILKDLSA